MAPAVRATVLHSQIRAPARGRPSRPAEAAEAAEAAGADPSWSAATAAPGRPGGRCAHHVQDEEDDGRRHRQECHCDGGDRRAVESGRR
jgi:hypothetical protein